jgi:hypothetical protein
MPTLIRNYYLHLNTEYGHYINGTSDYVRWTLNNKIVAEKGNYFKVRVLSAAIPYSFFQMSALLVPGYYTHGGIDSHFNLYIPAGNYPITTLLSVFQTQLEAVTHPHQWTFNFSYDSANSRCTLNFSSSQLFTFTFTYNAFWKALGFKPTDTLTFGNNPSTVNLVSSRHVLTHQVHTIYIRSDTLNPIEKNQEAICENITNTDILCPITIYSAANSWIQFTSDSSTPLIELTNNCIDVVQLYLSTNASYDVRISDLDWYVSLEIEEWKRDEIKPAEFDKEESLKALADLRQGLIADLNQSRQSLLS